MIILKLSSFKFIWIFVDFIKIWFLLLTESFPVWALLLIIFGVTLIIAVIASLFILKKIKLESELNDNWWKVIWDDIIFPENIVKSGHRSQVSIVLSDIDGCISGKTSANKSYGNSLMSAAGVIDSVLVAYYKGIKVAVKPLSVQKLHMSRQLLMEIKQVGRVSNYFNTMISHLVFKNIRPKVIIAYFSSFVTLFQSF